MTSILEIDYVEAERPYSQSELRDMRTKLHRSLRLGTTKAHHRRCDHFYLVKENGRKEKEIQEHNNVDVGNCSVCWKEQKTPRHLRTSARNMVSAYCNAFYSEPEYLAYSGIDLESVFYTWLYTE